MTPDVADAVEKVTGFRVIASSEKAVSGGCIHRSAIFETENGPSLFIKQNSAEARELFSTEFQSLEWIASTNTIRVPNPVGYGEAGGSAFLAMEAITLSSHGDSNRMGRHLSRLHSVTGDSFGADFDNFIGATPQPNTRTESWAEFFVDHRLGHMFHLAAKRGKTFARRNELLERVRDHLNSLDITPSLLHGDLWGGNAGFDEHGEPVLFDPACYLGDREADIAFTKVFGGFGPGFYRAYREEFSEPEPVRETIYNLYHILNHYVLFGGGYANQAEGMMEEILRALS
ncbi:MAG: fructosamine kinase family protein [Verrucomicrobiales bacterium]|nr:fructosamine kinase family protein [Verrucomicrobiales bacterium]